MQERPVWLSGGRIWTGWAPSGGAAERASSLLMEGGRAAAVGSEDQVGAHPAAARAESLNEGMCFP